MLLNYLLDMNTEDSHKFFNFEYKLIFFDPC